ncbi:MAG: Rieske (2Fe-2S) protein [Bacteroidota bacterium]|nr:Rieske (2Fe-2S) protein [Candidatus Kapabacteria bacterium]MDW8219745.1 Rieske (2Fe-2S) protein [Bacteroidota bacterium]
MIAPTQDTAYLHEDGASKRNFFRTMLWAAGIGYIVAPLYAVWRFLVSSSERYIPAPPLRLSQNHFHRHSHYYARLGTRNILVRRDSNAVFRAFDLRCTHAGCTVEWRAASQQFVCPCHGAIFHADGSVAKLPATSPLHELIVDVQEDSIVVYDTFKSE